MKSRTIRSFTETIEIKSLLLQRIRSHRYFVPVTVAALILALACIHVWQRVVVIELAKDVASLKQDNRRLVDVARKLQSETASLTMSSRIETYARDSLNLQSVTFDRLYTLVPGHDQTLPEDELSILLSSIKRVGEYLPAVSEAQAEQRDLRPIIFTPDETDGTGQ